MQLRQIEYIGSVPRRPEKKSPIKPLFAIFVLLLVGFGLYKFGVTDLIASQSNTVSKSSAQEFIAKNYVSETKYDQFMSAVLDRTTHTISYDPAYYEIAYPMGDIPAHKGVCTDVVIRSFRAIGVDLQELVHEDMGQHFDSYPKTWDLTKRDANIDHRRVPNLQNFFLRNGENLTISQTNPASYKPGDIVTWKLSHGAPHIGIVVPSPVEDDPTPWIVHNIGIGPQWEDCLFDYQITGHYRYQLD